nr:lysis protein [Xenorhabdus miraniensis]
MDGSRPARLAKDAEQDYVRLLGELEALEAQFLGLKDWADTECRGTGKCLKAKYLQQLNIECKPINHHSQRHYSRCTVWHCSKRWRWTKYKKERKLCGQITHCHPRANDTGVAGVGEDAVSVSLNVWAGAILSPARFYYAQAKRPPIPGCITEQ